MAGTVVIVAEYLAVLHFARDTLTRAGYRVVTSARLPSAYALARLYRPDVLVLQASTGEINAVEDTMAQLRGDPATAELGVVFLCGTSNQERLFDAEALLQSVQARCEENELAQDNNSVSA